jgi:pSer/pThr/pTyr-binding forkhead associated (FHA) protein
MKPTDFLSIRIGATGQKYTSGIEANSSRDRPGAEAGGDYSARLGWIQGVPYLIDLGSASTILVNGTPIAPYSPVIVQDGDTISMGNTHLTWNAAPVASQPSQEPGKAQAAEESVVMLGERAETPGPAAPAEPVSPSGEEEALARAQGAAEIPLAAEQVSGRTAPKAPEPTLLVPTRVTPPPAPETHEPTLLVPRRTARPLARETADSRTPAASELSQEPDEAAAYKTVWVDMAQILEEDKGLEFESTTILRDTRIPHLVVHLPNRTWEVQFAKDSMTLGRGEPNDVVIPEESVSQHHALIARRGPGYVIRDAGSSNGVWLGNQRVEEHLLRDGDVVSLGRARLVFKAGFVSDELTLIGTPRIDGKPMRRPVVFVPGLMGSELWLGSEQLWPNPRLILANVEIFRLPGDPRIEARGIVNEVVIVPNLIQARQYSALGDYLVTGLGYTRGKDLLEFGYDWRYDVRLSAQKLGEAIDRWGIQAPITIIAHSLGTLVTRYYVERLGGKQLVERIILMGGPHHGTAKGLEVILSGPGLLPFGLGAERMRQVLATFPTAYQILPTYPCVFDQNGNQIDLLEDDSWLPEAQRPHLRTARDFLRKLGTDSSVPTVSIFGYGLKTKIRAQVHRGPDGLWQKVAFVEEAAGDQSVPSGSAVLKDSEIHPVLQEHGSLYIDDDVRMRLKVELTRSTTWQRSK